MDCSNTAIHNIIGKTEYFVTFLILTDFNQMYWKRVRSMCVPAESKNKKQASKRNKATNKLETYEAVENV